MIYPLSAMRAAMKAAHEVLATLRAEGTQRGLIDRMQTRGELYDLIGYQEWEARDAAYFSGAADGAGTLTPDLSREGEGEIVTRGRRRRRASPRPSRRGRGRSHDARYGLPDGAG